MEFTNFTPVILMPESGVMGRAMAQERRLAQMGAVTLESSSVELSMALAVTISGLNNSLNL